MHRGRLVETLHHALFSGFATKFLRSIGAARRPSGRFDVRTLRPGEWIVRPGLVYRQIE